MRRNAHKSDTVIIGNKQIERNMGFPLFVSGKSGPVRKVSDSDWELGRYLQLWDLTRWRNAAPAAHYSYTCCGFPLGHSHRVLSIQPVAGFVRATVAALPRSESASASAPASALVSHLLTVEYPTNFWLNMIGFKREWGNNISERESLGRRVPWTLCRSTLACKIISKTRTEVLYYLQTIKLYFNRTLLRDW